MIIMIERPEIILVSRIPMTEDDPYTIVFQSPEGALHKVNFMRTADRIEWMEVLAVKVRVVDKVRTVYRMLDEKEAASLMWSEQLSRDQLKFDF